MAPKLYSVIFLIGAFGIVYDGNCKDVDNECPAFPPYFESNPTLESGLIGNFESTLQIQSCVIPPKENITLYGLKKDESQFKILDINNKTSVEECIDFTAPICVVVAGYRSKFYPTGGYINAWANALATAKQSNIIIFEWSRLSFQSYPCLVLSIVPECAEYLASSIKTLNEIYNIPYNEFVFTGHSAGAHLIGRASENLPEKVPICFALDVASPLYAQGIGKGISSTSCKKVIALHSAGATFGYATSIGTSDIFANGGLTQPNCKISDNVFCSHLRAVFYSTEAGKHHNEFVVVSETKNKTEIDLLDFENIFSGRNNLNTTGCFPYYD